MENWSAHHVYSAALDRRHSQPVAQSLASYAHGLRTKSMPVIFTLAHLAQITGVRFKTLHNTVTRRREAANYRLHWIRKRSGGKRPIHSVSRELARVHQFVNEEILQRIQPHPASFAFHPSGGIASCARQHCGARWLFQYDIENFFFTINEIDVYWIFVNLGFRHLLSFELARLCTTIRLPYEVYDLRRHSDFKLTYQSDVFNLYAHPILGVLPQGAASSPMLANLACVRLDHKLSDAAESKGMVYTRYADDICISSAQKLSRKRDVSNIHHRLRGEITSEGFSLNNRKTRISGPGSRKRVLGLLVDGDAPRLSKDTRHRIDRLLYACEKFGIVETAIFEGFDSAVGLYNHLGGLTAHACDVDIDLGKNFRQRFKSLATFESN